MVANVLDQTACNDRSQQSCIVQTNHFTTPPCNCAPRSGDIVIQGLLRLRIQPTLHILRDSRSNDPGTILLSNTGRAIATLSSGSRWISIVEFASDIQCKDAGLGAGSVFRLVQER